MKKERRSLLIGQKVMMDFAVTRTNKGFKHIELLADEDNKTTWLYEQWETKEDHQAYLNFRIKNGFED